MNRSLTASLPTPESDVYRYGDLDPFPTDPTLIASILEDHTIDLPAQVESSLVLVSTSTHKVHPIISGSDFYSSPRFSPSGSKLAWVSWDHPEMPWTRSSLWIADVNVVGGKVNLEQVLVPGSERKIAGMGTASESVSQPRWAQGTDKEEDKLVFLSDKTGFLEFYVWDSKTGESGLLLEKPQGVDMGGELELSSLVRERYLSLIPFLTAPDWVLGQSSHASLSATQWVGTSAGQLHVIDLNTRQTTILSTPFQSISALKVVSPTQLFVTASPSTSPTVLALLTLVGNSVHAEIVKSSSAAQVEPEFISEGQHISYPTKSAPGEAAGQVAYATFYEPSSKLYAGMDGELPPLVVRCHGTYHLQAASAEQDLTPPPSFFPHFFFFLFFMFCRWSNLLSQNGPRLGSSVLHLPRLLVRRRELWWLDRVWTTIPRTARQELGYR